MDERLPRDPDGLVVTQLGPVNEWLRALVTNSDEWIAARGRISAAGGYRRKGRRPGTPAPHILLVFDTLLSWIVRAGPSSAASRVDAYDCAKLVLPDLRRAASRRGVTRERYATADADKAEWVRETLKRAKFTDGMRSLALALFDCGALGRTPLALADAELWLGPPDDSKFAGASQAMGWFYGYRRASEGSVDRLVNDLVVGPLPSSAPRGEMIAYVLDCWANGEPAIPAVPVSP